MPEENRSKPYATEVEQQKPDGGHTTEPVGSEGSSKTSKTRTDPHTGEPTEGRPDTAG